jgi:2-iminobutanoate/2-iminopropanoate deaminase
MPSRSSARPILWPRVPLGAAALFLSMACAAPVDEPASSARTDRSTAVAFLNSGLLPDSVPFSEAVRVGNVVQLSGQLGARPGEMRVVPGGLEAEARQTLDNIRNTLATHGLRMDDIVKCTIMLADMSEWAAFNAIYATYFTPPYPTRSAMGVSGLALGARVEAECMAVDGAADAKMQSAR